MLSAAPRASLTLPSCSHNYPRASRIGWTHARHYPFLNYKGPGQHRFGNPKKKKVTGYNALHFQPAETWTHDICILGRREDLRFLGNEKKALINSRILIKA